MSSLAARRLKKIEAALEPTEAMALWLAGAREEFSSLPELAESLRHQREEALPLFQLTHQAEANAKRRLKGRASVFAALSGARAAYMEEGSRAAVRDAATLWYLFLGVNERFRQERRALTLLVALLAADSRVLTQDEKAGGGERLADRIAAALLELYSWQDAVKMLREEYYEGVSPLLPEAEEHLGWLVEQAERLGEGSNDYLELQEPESGQSSTPIGLARIRQDAEPAVEALIHLLVTAARTEAHEMMGEHKQALALLQRHVSHRG